MVPIAGQKRDMPTRIADAIKDLSLSEQVHSTHRVYFPCIVLRVRVENKRNPLGYISFVALSSH